MSEHYQVMPPLSADEYAALKADIAERGIQVPVEADEDGNTLDGHHRRKIADELGIECPTITRSFASEQEKLEHAMKLNLLRRQVGPISWANLFKKLCELRGVELGRGKRNDKRTSVTMTEVASELGVSESTARRRLRLANDLTDAPDIAAKVDSGEMPPTQARSKAKRAERERRRAGWRESIERQRREFVERAKRGEIMQVLRMEASHTYDFERPGEPVKFALVEEATITRHGVISYIRKPVWDDDEGEAIFPIEDVPLLWAGEEQNILKALQEHAASITGVNNGDVCTERPWAGLDWLGGRLHWRDTLMGDPWVEEPEIDPLVWCEDGTLFLPTGRWAAYLVEGKPVRWWVWDEINSRTASEIRKAADPGFYDTKLLSVREHYDRHDGSSPRWVRVDGLLEALSADLAAIKAHKQSTPT